MGARFLSSTGLGSGNLIGRAQFPPAPALDKNQSPQKTLFFSLRKVLRRIPFPKFWSRRYAERIWGEFFILVRRILGKLPANFSANFDGEFFGLVFPGLQATQKIHAQNSRPELSAFISNFTLLNPKFIHGDFLLARETKTCPLPIASHQAHSCFKLRSQTAFLRG